MTFRLTEEDYNNAKRTNSQNCPIARCIRRTLNEPVIVTQSFISIRNKILFNTPHKVAQYIINYDMKLITKFEPFEFQLPFKK